MSKEKKITIIEIDDKRQQIDTKLTDAREVLRILSTTIGGFVVELSQQNPDQQKQLKDLFDRNRSLFDLPSASIVHGDLSAGFKNMLILNKSISGIVDMEGVKANDPIDEFAYYHFWTGWTEKDFEALKDGYGNKALFDDTFMKKLYLYNLLRAHLLKAYYHSRGNESGLSYAQKKQSELEVKLT